MSTTQSVQSDEFLDKKSQKFSHLFSYVEKVTMKSTTVRANKITEQSGEIPQERSGHYSGLYYEVQRVDKGNGNTIEVIPKCLTFGGDNIAKEKLNDLFELDFNTYKWKRLDYQQNQVPEPRVYFSGCINKQTGRLYIFGGDSGTVDQRLNNFYEYTIPTQQWRKIQTNGYSPEKRSGHSCCILPDTGAIVVFGGLNNAKKFNDLNIFDFETNKWDKISKNDMGDVPDVRCAHSAVIFPLDFDKSTPNYQFLQNTINDPTFDAQFPFFEDGSEESTMSDLTATESSSYISTSAKKSPFPSSKPKDSASASSTSSSTPRIRMVPLQKLVKNSPMLASMTKASSYRMIVFAGRKDNQSLYNDTYEFNFVTKMWKRIETVGNQPAKREGHVAARISPFEMIIFGGYNRERDFNDMYKLDLRTNTWVKIAIIGEAPNPMCYMSCISLFDPDVGAASLATFQNLLKSSSQRINRTASSSATFVSDGKRSSSMYSIQSNPFLVPNNSLLVANNNPPANTNNRPRLSPLNQNQPAINPLYADIISQMELDPATIAQINQINQNNLNAQNNASSSVQRRPPQLTPPPPAAQLDAELSELDAEEVQSTVTAPVSMSSGGYYEDEDTVPPSMMDVNGGFVVPVYTFGGWSQQKVNDLFRFDFIYEPPTKFHYTERLLHYVYENLFEKSQFFDVLIGCTASEDSNFSAEGMAAAGVVNPNGVLSPTSSSTSLRSITSETAKTTGEKKEVFVMGHKFIISQSPVIAELLEQENCISIDSKSQISEFFAKNTVAGNSPSVGGVAGGISPRSYVSSYSTISNTNSATTKPQNTYHIIKLKNISQDILSKMLEFMYGADPEFTAEDYPTILEKSVDLKLETVKNWALSKFDAKISNKNVFQILKFSEINKEEFLKGKCLSYIQKNKKELLQQKTEMKSLSKELLIELALSEATGEKFHESAVAAAAASASGSGAPIFGNSQTFYSKRGIIQPAQAFLKHMLTMMPEISLENQSNLPPMSPTSKSNKNPIRMSPEKKENANIPVKKQTNKYFDVEFKLDEGVIIKAHKSILTIRSIYFQSMFNSDFVESKMSQIDLNEVRARPFMFVLMYLYGIPLFIPEDSAVKDLIDIFSTANLLSLKEVERDALRELCNRVNVDNLGEMIELVAKYKLKGSSLEMECRSQLERMSQTEVIDWVFAFAKKFSFG